MTELSGKVVVVTGAGSGIGRALALALADKQCRLALSDIDESSLEATAALLPASTKYSLHQLDVASRGGVTRFADEVMQAHGEVHVLINNAGVTLIDRAESAAIEDFEWVMNINFWGVVYGTKAFLPHLRQAKEAHIVNISSLFGLMAMPLQSAYNASKFAVRGFTESLKMELSASAIKVSCVHPGGIKTAITRNARVAEEELDESREKLNADFDSIAGTTAESAAAQIIRGIEKNKRRILIGKDAKVADWLVRHFPSSYEKIMGLEKRIRAKAASLNN